MSGSFLSLPFQSPRLGSPGNATSANSKNSNTEEADPHTEVPYEPLSISVESEQLVGSSGTGGATEQMGLKDDYQRPERRNGDDVAQLVAIVCLLRLAPPYLIRASGILRDQYQ